MNGKDLIEANRDVLIDAYEDEFGGLPCVVGVRKEDGQKVALFYRGDVHVDCKFEFVDLDSTIRVVSEILSNSQPGEEFRTHSDDRLAKILRSANLPFWTDENREVHPGKAPS